MTSVASRLKAMPWIWSYVAAFVVWLTAMIAASGVGGSAMISAALTFSVFAVLVGIGQMFVIASGPGNIDLSIPAVIAVSGFVAMKVMGGSDAMILPGLLLGLLSGALFGLVNCATIWLFQVPPIISTLSMSMIIQSITISFGRGLLITPPPFLAFLTTYRVAGIPISAIATIVLAAAMAAVLRYSIYGRSVLAIGQNENAARLAGVKVWRTRFLTFMLSGLFAGLCGVLLSGMSGGASLDMGNEYMLTSIALVVIGGSSVSGGRANLTGIWGAALFLFLLISMLNSLGVGSGWRLVLNGLIIIAVIVVAGGDDS
ncbi:ABC transporter permease [uncultured Pleomorphomonas sp.]|uniref:ABC transporter permease n=1 Tax=uncultured Pleomorphomonas sp. TaxID=442121 RepID=A0A212LGJ5_9HYPH|nr:ABC transporter permease [uncultured Pleomorphomonas sp.]SCM76509.1 ABC transporter permease [uncultured Pleomorphomonas sp.]